MADETDAIAGLLVGGLVAAGIFIAVILGTCIGAFTGWIVSITPFLGGWVVVGFKMFGIDASDKLVMIGAMLGFVSGFIRSSIPKG